MMARPGGCPLILGIRHTPSARSSSNPTVVDDGAKLIGLHIEMGVGESAAEFFQASSRNRNQVMQRDWTWHAFLRALRGDG